jgi:ABC-type uncharacterized transport system permease subunit
MQDLYLHGAAWGYVAATVLLYLQIIKGKELGRGGAIAFAVIGIIFHSLSQRELWLAGGPIVVNFLDVLSLSALAVIMILVLSTLLRQSFFDAGLFALPFAALVVLAEWLLPVRGSLVQNASPAIALHIVGSISAFGLLVIAGLYALFVATTDHFLRQRRLNPLVRALPALDVMEALLFQLITAGFVLLTISLTTGLLFVEDLFAQHLVHKSTLAIAAWLVFGTLLVGRWAWGWRGRTAVRLTIAGVLLLVLAYFGSKFVLEVIFGQSWG